MSSTSEFDPPEKEGVCDVCGAELEVRDDDKPEVIRHRLATYREKTEPLIDYYEARGLLKRVDGDRSPGGGHRHDSQAARDPGDGRGGLGRCTEAGSS